MSDLLVGSRPSSTASTGLIDPAPGSLDERAPPRLRLENRLHDNRSRGDRALRPIDRSFRRWNFARGRTGTSDHPACCPRRGRSPRSRLLHGICLGPIGINTLMNTSVTPGTAGPPQLLSNL